MNSQGRPTRPNGDVAPRRGTFTGNRALDMEEALIFESGRIDATGVDFEAPPPFASKLGAHAREGTIGLPGLTEPEAVRHYVRLSRNNYSIDAGLYPLGSCTMKHNPRLNKRWRVCRASPTFIPCSRSPPCRARWSSSTRWRTLC